MYTESRLALSAMRIASFFVSAVICVNLRPIKFKNPMAYGVRHKARGVRHKVRVQRTRPKANLFPGVPDPFLPEI